MLNRLPKIIDPLQLADKNASLSGQIAISDLKRLADSLHNSEGIIDIELSFAREGRVIKIDGSMKGVLQLVCQNCLHAISWSINNTIKLGVVSTIELADKLPEGYEPLLVNEEGEVVLNDLIEDELIIQLPDYPKHSYTCWNETPPVIDNSNAPFPEKTNPFSILANLKKK